MDNERLNEIETALNGLRSTVNDDSRTARAMDRNDSWEDVAAAATKEGYDEIATIARDAANEWEE